jgi:ABC-type Mn2+/Zn2+ transport system permease subunit
MIAAARRLSRSLTEGFAMSLALGIAVCVGALAAVVYIGVASAIGAWDRLRGRRP